MGEIGFPRREFLHELKWWEVRAIIRGYRRRSHPQWEQARLIAYQAHYSMGVPKGESAKTLSEWLPFSWEKKQGRPISLEEEQELLAEMDAINQALDNGT